MEQILIVLNLDVVRRNGADLKRETLASVVEQIFARSFPARFSFDLTNGVIVGGRAQKDVSVSVRSSSIAIQDPPAIEAAEAAGELPAHPLDEAAEKEREMPSRATPGPRIVPPA